MNHFSEKLLTWYDIHQRQLPWRADPHPYYILVSEFMLQQTRMETVLPYYHRFIEALPTIEQLASASEEQLLKLWEGLGYYRRVKNLHQTAQLIVAEHGGIVPSDPEVLKRFPGIGDYVAGAIASTAYQVKVSAIDGNVLRILSRLYCNEDDLSRAGPKRDLQSKLLALLPTERVGDFNQALMELGALVCLPNARPLCETCPVSADCCAYQTADPLDFPRKKDRRKVPVHLKTVLVVRSEEAVLVEPFGPGLLEGLASFPMKEGHLSPADIKALYPEAIISSLGPARHVFSHLKWDMIGYQVLLAEPEADWTPLSRLDRLSFPTALAVYRSSLEGSVSP
ncbi:MAG TPA: A/G-specific adenine glycosylase [Tissierellia bacterium]|nr:A/G-specific adenine glycosylase [Tissierellia bacterium]